ncbi:WD40 repeat domain-containing protein [Dictyobacter arantiisoli]|uniref:WD40 repeat domain-containing protein n=1 Tax=Dictyobacter arantiisoli TaxID=2014874 RepID=UPI0011F08073|nr:WD40 repeat domain-containing protein [Dictyobacter arantiisoli]
MEEPSVMVCSHVVGQTCSRMLIPDGTPLSDDVSAVLAVAWRNEHAASVPAPGMISLACVGPASTVQVWDCCVDADSLYVCAQTYYGHTDELTALVWSPDTTMLASASEDHTVQVWNARTGRTVMLYRGQECSVRALGWSPDGRWLAIGGDNNTIQVVNIVEQYATVIYNGHAQGCYGIDAVAWSPDGRYVASAGDDNRVQVWDAFTGQCKVIYEGHLDCWVLAVAWSPDGGWIASGGDDIHVWSVKTGMCRQIYHKHEYMQHWIDHIDWSPDGCVIASTSTDAVLHIWEVWTGLTLQTQRHPGNEEACRGLLTNALAWSTAIPATLPGERSLVFASCDKTVSLIRLL